MTVINSLFTIRHGFWPPSRDAGIRLMRLDAAQAIRGRNDN